MWELPPVISRYAISCLHWSFYFAILGSCKQQQNNNMQLLLFWKSWNGKYGRYFVFTISKYAQKLFYIRLLTLNVLQKWTSFDAEMQQRTLGNCKMLLRIIWRLYHQMMFSSISLHIFFLVVINLTNGKRWKHHIQYFPIFEKKDP